jgi:hypothetical protein
MTGLASLYRRNPYDERLKTTAGMLDRSGAAKPLLMGKMGEMVRQAEDYDTESSATVAGIYREDMDRQGESAMMKDADDAIKAASDLAKQDPIAATQYFNDRAKRNKYIPKGITFRRSMDGQAIMEVKDAKGGQRGIINASNMLDEAQAAEQKKGAPLTDEERGGLAQRHFYPTPGYEKPGADDSEKKLDLFQTWKTTFKKEKGRSPSLTEIERYHRSSSGSGEGEGKVKATDSKALKIELARKYAPLAVRLIEAKGKAATPKELEAVKAIKAALSNVDPLTKDFNADSVYASLPAEEQDAFDRIFLDAEEAFPQTGRVAGAVNDAMSAFHKRRKATKPAKTAGAGDWKKYLKKK